nr:unnamed protein product [Callosobruchus chinensis]
MESSKSNRILRQIVSQRSCFIMDQVGTANSNSQVSDQPCTSRSSLLQYAEDSDDSNKDPNYCPIATLVMMRVMVRMKIAVLSQEKECRMHWKLN